MIAVTGADYMAKKVTPPVSEPEQPASETVRVATELVEMLREICFNTRDSRGRRLKLTQVVDELLRPAVLRRYTEFKRQAGQADED